MCKKILCFNKPISKDIKYCHKCICQNHTCHHSKLSLYSTCSYCTPTCKIDHCIRYCQNGYSLCKYHKCPVGSCQNKSTVLVISKLRNHPPIVIKRYCYDHRCIVNTCSKKKHNKLTCLLHKCVIDQCDNHKINEKYCKMHMCQHVECKLESLHNINCNYCPKHKCKFDDTCTTKTLYKKNYCKTHKCAVCEQSKTDNAEGCPKHICNIHEELIVTGRSCKTCISHVRSIHETVKHKIV
jgi:hypothetical protein